MRAFSINRDTCLVASPSRIGRWRIVVGTACKQCGERLLAVPYA